MFERFTDRARRTLVIAQEELRAMGHPHIEVDHVLLALVVEADGVAGRALAGLGIDAEQVRAAIVERRGVGNPEALPKHLPFTPAAKKVLELSLREALQLGHNYIGTEHLLLGIVRAEPNPGTAILKALGAEPAEVRKAVIRVLSEYTNVTLAEAVGETTAKVSKALKRERSRKEAATGPTCPKCDALLSATARYTTWDVPEASGRGTASVLFLYCSGCGHTIDDVILPSE